jgi:putative flippase GtrA
VIARLVRSGAAGAIAAGADLLSLAGLVQLAGVEPRVASVPALIVGAVVMFFGQKYFAFAARGGSIGRELILFALVQLGGLALTALLFDVTLRIGPSLSPHYLAVRLVTTNLVWLLYSFPLWHFVFRSKPGETSDAG